MKTAVVTTRVDPDLKQNTAKIFEQLGLSTSQAITLFLKQVYLQKGLPFQVALPNAETEAALADAQTHRNLSSAETPEALFDDLDI